ncbi:MAG: DUF2141 domain-containing protein [Alphaproteobacteria bacterium]|jgi:uncharacterized protein (DUF2141 family)|nr:DUF2141 domain-containing protein [Alphaproteobacteria bacterium]MBU2041456.1 DUF2141 domain-containing protein [Alphaproteobacteria bacterium]MBU2125938.1 DUF2141 domain-containing protein [Alphaproteobacteria bacterium]MBU2208331.1 DUF2141 domain-containing protein [Alphaproteobacteria bacterium]MBU2290445.1 DUF2141 domain-containing protein [Alphaproteobacteria bacterium]
MIRFAAAAALLLSAAPALAQDDSRIVLTFETGARTGMVMVALYNSASSFDGGSGQPTAVAAVRASGRAVEAVFENLPAGDYGVKAFHDIDGDGEMDTNPFGMPTEPFAFSNNAVGNMGPARWDRARFTVSGETAQTISLR